MWESGTQTDGVQSLSWIVTVELAGLPSEAPPVGDDSATVKVSSASVAESLTTVTAMLLSELSPLAQESVPLAPA